MNSTMLLIAALLVILLGSLPAWPYSRSWGYGPSSIVGVILAVLIALAFMHPA